METKDLNGLRFSAGPVMVHTASQTPNGVTMTDATFDIDSVQIKTLHTPAPIPGTLWAYVLKIFNLTNVVAYVIALFVNILVAYLQGEAGLLVPLLFAVSQVFEQCEKPGLCCLQCL